MKKIPEIIRHEAEQIMKAEKPRFRTAAFLLYLLSLVYGSVLFFRRVFYRTGILKSKSLPCPVISVGNITAGGSGKTPMTIYLADLLSEKGFRPAIVSRGYKGGFENKGGIVSDGEKILASPSEAGDEPYMMAVKTGVPVVCGSNRYLAGIEALKLGADVIILDDGFQHIRLHRNINLLLMDMTKPLGNGFIIPRGLMREPVSALNDADAVIMTRCNEINPPPDIGNGYNCLNGILPEYSGKDIPVFYSSHRQFIAGSQGTDKIGGQQYGNLKVLAVSGIADNRSFAKSLEDSGFHVAGHAEFDDHYSYTTDDLGNILQAMENIKADIIATTEKDFVKLSEIIEDKSFWTVFGVEHDFGDSRPDFDRWIIEKVSECSSFMKQGSKYGLK